MVQTIHFNNWLYPYLGLVRFLLILILFAGVAQFASFALIQAHAISFYGAQPEDISFALQIAYAGIITTLPVQFRLVKYFNTKSYLLTAFLAGVVLNIGGLYIHDLLLLATLRFLTGVVTCIVAGCMLMAIFSTLPETKRMIVGISLFFSLILTCSVIVGIGTSWIVLKTNWTAVYFGLIGIQIMAIVLCLFIFKSKSTIKSYPLYQIDWFGCILFMFGAAATAFVMIYGPKRYWFADDTIRHTAIFAGAILLLFLLRQSNLKRPLVNLNAFRTGKFIFAVFLMLLFWGIKDSINLIYGYSASVLGWSSADVVRSGLLNTAGVITATFIAVKVILAEKKNLPKLLLAGFAVMFFYHTWIYMYITPDLSFTDLSIPIFFHGFACGLLFVPITLFCVATLPQNIALSGIIICAYARFIATLNSIAGFYTLQLNYNQLFKESFFAKLTAGSHILSQRLELYKTFLISKGHTAHEATGISNMMIAKSSAIQSQLLTIRAIFLVVAIVAASVFIILIIFALVNKVKTANAKAVSILPSA